MAVSISDSSLLRAVAGVARNGDVPMVYGHICERLRFAGGGGFTREFYCSCEAPDPTTGIPPDVTAWVCSLFSGTIILPESMLVLS